MKKLLFFFGLFIALVWGFSLKNTINIAFAHDWDEWTRCVSIGSQCNNDMGTQSKHADYIVSCPTGYDYQHSEDNWNKKCRKWVDTTFKCPDADIAYSALGLFRQCQRSFSHWPYTRYATYMPIDVLAHFTYSAPTSVTCPTGFTQTGSGKDTVCSQTQACHTGVKDYSACTPAGVCPTACGQSATTVPDGHGGTKSCPATSACVTPSPSPTASPTPEPTTEPTASPTATPIPTCNPDDPQSNSCNTYPSASPTATPSESPSPTPEGSTPTPTPTNPPSGSTPTPRPTDTPTSTSGKWTGFNLGAMYCPVHSFDVTAELKKDGNSVSNVNVTFTYKQTKKTSRTGGDGKTSISFDYVGDDTVYMDVEDSEYPSRSVTVVASNCPPESSSSSSSSQGQVLGANTGLASTGVIEDVMMDAIGWIGGGFTVAGSLMYGKKRFS